MINLIILITSLALSFTNLFAVRIIFLDSEAVAVMRSILVIGLMLSPITIFGLDTVIGKINEKIIAKLYYIFLLGSVILTVIIIIFEASYFYSALLALTIGMSQFNASIYLIEGKDFRFKIYSQLAPKIILVLSLILTSIIGVRIQDFMVINSILLILLNIAIYLGNNQSNRVTIHLTKKDLNELSQLALTGLSALFISDLVIRMPYLMSLNGPPQISNEYDIATAFTSTWILPLAIATRIDEVKSGYNYKRYSLAILQKKMSINLQVLVLVISSIIIIRLVTAFSFISETFDGIMIAMLSTGWPAFLIILFPNTTRMYFLTKDHILANGNRIYISIVTIMGTFYLASRINSQIYLSIVIFLIIYLMNYALRSTRMKAE